MNQFSIRIAGYVIQIETQYANARFFCQQFLTDDTPDFAIRVKQRDIEKAYRHREGRYLHDTRFDGMFEITALHELMAECLIDKDVLLMHGAVIALNNEAYLFTAPSGTGKTTQIYRWLDHCPDAIVINGDKPFIRFSCDGSSPLACGSPWAGKENMYTNSTVPLKSIVLMERAEENHIDYTSFSDAFPMLLQQAYCPEDQTKMRKTLQLLQRFAPAVSFWRFRCNNLKPDSFTVAYTALTGREP